MKCPFCEGEMEQGFIQGGNVISWTKEIHKISTLPKAGEILLWQGLLKPSALPSHICKQCKRIIVDYSDLEIREG